MFIIGSIMMVGAAIVMGCCIYAGTSIKDEYFDEEIVQF